MVERADKFCARVVIKRHSCFSLTFYIQPRVFELT